MKLLLTGAAGYTGKGMAQVLRENGHWVRGCDINDQVDNVDDIILCDIADLDHCRAAVEGVEAMVLCHMAPNPTGYETPPLAIDVNVKGTANLYHVAVEQKVSRIVLISSTGTLLGGIGTAIPGDGPYSYTNKHKMGFYALTKILQECLARWYWEAHKMPTAILRPSWIVYDGTFTTKYGAPVKNYSSDLMDPRDIGMAAVKALALPDLTLEAFNIGLDTAAFDLSAAHNRLGWQPRYLFKDLPGSPMNV
jgi:nucleoside-diphosphate-sugar epimerase